MKRIVLLSLFSLFIITGTVFSKNALAASGIADASLAPMLKKVMPAVVNIAAQGEVVVPAGLTNKKPNSSNGNSDNNSNSDNSNPSLPYGSLREFASLGSGVILDAAKGYIITNAHVLKEAKTITVTLSDGRTFKAKLIGSDSASDIALIQIPAEKLTAMPVGNSDSLQVGDFVAAIGNPFGLSQTATTGIVSALKRGGLGIEGPQGLENFIQTDASINPGNSGGALVNFQGQLIGINTAILSPEGGNIGIGFAIPINMARTIVAQLIQYGAVKRGLMGVIVQDLTPDLADGFNTPNAQGAVVTLVSPNSPASKAGLQSGDIIQTLDGQNMLTAAAVRNAVGVLRVGAKINLQVLRHGKSVDLEVVTADPELYIKKTEKDDPFLFGLSLRNFDQQTPAQGHVSGVQIVYVSKNSAAWRASLIPGDVIVSANQKPVKTIAELQDAAKDNNKHLLLNILRGTGGMFVVLD
jgi:serine protease Do